ncbi:MAG: sulfatase [Planctomycetes bacterium]|nr:sulfatase [Planctomycetota bacterium]
MGRLMVIQNVTLSLLLAFITVMLSGCGNDTVLNPCNVILISLDTLRADHLGTYGYDRNTSPNLDILANQGIVFDRAIAQASSTTPSHRSLFHSKPASAYKSDGLRLQEVLLKHGYRTAAFTGGGNISKRLGFGRGFELYCEDKGGLAISIPRARRWLEQLHGEPFFLFLHTYDIHLPYDPPPPHDTLFYPGYQGSIKGEDTRDLLRRIRKLGEYKDTGGEVVLSESDRRRIIALYDGGIHYTDEKVGDFLTLLEELKLARETLVVVFSDHGEEFWDHGLVSHAHTVFEELVHVPMIWRFPGEWRAGSRVSESVPLMDIAPTILDFLRIEKPDAFEGHSLLPLMKGEKEAPRPTLSEQEGLCAWTEFPWKLIIEFSDSAAPLLFNLESDPEECHDLRNDQQEISKTLAKNLSKALAGRTVSKVRAVDEGIENEDLLERLRALGYID